MGMYGKFDKIKFHLFDPINYPNTVFKGTVLNMYTENKQTLRIWEYIGDECYLEWLKTKPIKGLDYKCQPFAAMSHYDWDIIIDIMSGYMIRSLINISSSIDPAKNSAKLDIIKKLYYIVRDFVSKLILKLVNFDKDNDSIYLDEYNVSLKISKERRMINPINGFIFNISDIDDKYIDFRPTSSQRIAYYLYILFCEKNNVRKMARSIFEMFDEVYPLMIPTNFWTQF